MTVLDSCGSGVSAFGVIVRSSTNGPRRVLGRDGKVGHGNSVAV
jgi:hypothetical protein